MSLLQVLLAKHVNFLMVASIFFGVASGWTTATMAIYIGYGKWLRVLALAVLTLVALVITINELIICLTIIKDTMI